MRIDWVHPSWRDLVIEQLAADAELRTRFLSSCELPGALLALSASGGALGERVLPLLRADADWDALTGRLRIVVRDDPTAVLSGLVEAASALAFDPRRLHELRAMAHSVLTVVRTAWAAAPATMDAAGLSLWFALGEELEPPPCAAAVLALAPAFDLDLSRGADVARLDDWAALVEVIADARPDDLERIHFPGAFAADVVALFERAKDAGGGAHGRLVRTGIRLNRLGFGIDLPIRRLDPERLDDAPPAPATETWGSPVPSSLVERVLRDL